MGFVDSPSAILLVSAPALFFFIFIIHAVHHYFRRNNKAKKPVLPQISYFKSDPSLRRSLYSCKDVEATNPRDSTASLILKDSRYAVEPSTDVLCCQDSCSDTCSDSSCASSTLHPCKSRASLTAFRRSLYGNASILDSMRNNSTTSLISTGKSPSSSSRTQSVCMEQSEPFLATLRQAIYKNAIPALPPAQYSSQTLPMVRRKSLSPVRVNARMSHKELREDMLRPKSMYMIRDSFSNWPGQGRDRLSSNNMPDIADNLNPPKRRSASTSPNRSSRQQKSPSGNTPNCVTLAESIEELRSSNTRSASGQELNSVLAYDPFVQWARQVSIDNGGNFGDPEKTSASAVKQASSPCTITEPISVTIEHYRSMPSEVGPPGAVVAPVAPVSARSHTAAPCDHISPVFVGTVKVSNSDETKLTVPSPMYAPRFGRRGASYHLPRTTEPYNPNIKRSLTTKLARWSSLESLRPSDKTEFQHFDSYVC